MPKPLIHDGNDYREMTAAEYAQYVADQETIAAQTAALEQIAAAKASARAKLAALGLTDAEIAALLGA